MLNLLDCIPDIDNTYCFIANGNYKYEKSVFIKIGKQLNGCLMRRPFLSENVAC